MSNARHGDPDTHPTDPHRRKFLAASLLGATAAMLTLSPKSWGVDQGGAARPAPAGFISVSRLLTGHDIDGSLADRAWKAIGDREKDFDTRFGQLEAAIKASGLSSYTAWNDSPLAADAALKATALAIVSAWYLGVVGKVSDRSEDGPEFITYEGALMWRPTVDVTVIPTYTRGGPGYWKDKPPSVGTD